MKSNNKGSARLPLLDVRGAGKWQLPPTYEEEQVQDLARQLNIPVDVASILLRRSGGSLSGAKSLWTGECGYPDIWALPGVKEGLQRLEHAICRKEHVLVYSDFDADGVTSAVILKEALCAAGVRDVSVFLPSRFEDGYGFHAHLIPGFAENGVNLIITADCGIVACEACDKARQFGIDVIITDHHKLGNELPAAFCIIDPHLPSWRDFDLDDLSGAGVAYLLARGLLEKRRLLDNMEPDWATDLLTLSIAGDGQAVRGLNRVWIVKGLKSIQESSRPGILALLLVSGLARLKADSYLARLVPEIKEGIEYLPMDVFEDLHIDTDALRESLELSQLEYERDIMFGLVPRINAAGRMEHANWAFNLLCEENVARSIQIALQLEKANQERRKTESSMIEECFNQIKDKGDMCAVVGDDIDLSGEIDLPSCYPHYSVFAYQPLWHEGIIGIGASRLRDAYGRPCALVGGEGPIFKGSVRGIDGFNVYECLSMCEEFLVSYGGHEGAAGFTIEEGNIPSFAHAFEAACEETFLGVSMEQIIELDGIIGPQQLKGDFLDYCLRLEPFGKGNPVPTFAIEGSKIIGLRLLGKDMNHLELIADAGDPMRFMWFNAGERGLESCFAGKCDIAFTPSRNTYMGQDSISFFVKDMRPAWSLFGHNYSHIAQDISNGDRFIIYTWSKDAAFSLYVALMRAGIDCKLHLKGERKASAHDARDLLRSRPGVVISTCPWDLLRGDEDFEVNIIALHPPISHCSLKRLSDMGYLTNINLVHLDRYLGDSRKWIECRFPIKESIERVWNILVRSNRGEPIPVWRLNPLVLTGIGGSEITLYEQQLLLLQSCISIFEELGMVRYDNVYRTPVLVLHKPKGKVNLRQSQIYSHGLGVRKSASYVRT